MNVRRLGRVAMLGATGVAVAGAGVGIGLGLGAWAWWRRRNAEDLADKVVLITGSSRGLGFVMAQEFAARGARIVLCARDAAELDWAREELTRRGARVLAVQCDVGDSESVNHVVRQALERFGSIDILVNNAGMITVGPVETQTPVDFQEALDVMFWGVVNPTLAVLPHMLHRRSGRIANVTSIGGKVSVPHLLPYNCAKFAAVGFSEGLRAELRKDNIKVTTIVPGLMRTGSHVNAFFKSKNQAEYTWFSLGATLPLVSINARRAAKKIVGAVRRGDAELIITPQAKLLTMFHGLFPGLTSDLLGIANRFLPGPGGVGEQRRTGKESESAVSKSFVETLGRVAADRFHQNPEKRGARGGETAPGTVPGTMPA